VDYKNYNKGPVSLLENKPKDIKYVFLNNQAEVSIWFDGFGENALPIEKGTCSKQCECVIFPESDGHRDWVLFIEMKYADSLENAFSEEYDYPYCTVEQILETVKYFRTKGILGDNRRVTAIISFPNLIEEFNGFFFDYTDYTPESILAEHKILLYPTNSATIVNNKRIKLE
jgi:hypothetical protein